MNATLDRLRSEMHKVSGSISRTTARRLAMDYADFREAFNKWSNGNCPDDYLISRLEQLQATQAQARLYLVTQTYLETIREGKDIN